VDYPLAAQKGTYPGVGIFSLILKDSSITRNLLRPEYVSIRVTARSSRIRDDNHADARAVTPDNMQSLCVLGTIVSYDTDILPQSLTT
jgi:hypothetical protein